MSTRSAHIYVILSLIVLWVLGSRPLSESKSKKMLQIAEELVWDDADSALTLLKRIAPSSLMDSSMLAAYHLATTQAAYHAGHPLTQDSLIRLSVAYYASAGRSSEHLCRSLLYLSNVYIDMDSLKAAYRTALEAEHLLQADYDPRLQCMVYNTLFYLCRVQGLLSESVEYYKGAERLCLEHGFQEWLFNNRYAILNLPWFEQHRDSAETLISQLLSVIGRMPLKNRSSAYNNIGFYYERSGNDSLALHYYGLSLSSPQTFSVSALLNAARIHDRNGNTLLSDSLYDVVYPLCTPVQKVRLYRNLLLRGYRKGKMSEVVRLAVNYEKVLDDYHDSIHWYELASLRSAFDNEQALNRAVHHRHRLLTFSILSLLFIYILWMMYHKYMSSVFRKQRRQFLRLSELLAELQQSYIIGQSRHDKERQMLNQRLAEMLDKLKKKDQQIEQWHTLYNHVVRHPLLTIEDIRALNLYIGIRYLRRPFMSSSEHMALLHWLNLTDDSFADRWSSYYPHCTSLSLDLVCLFRLGFSVQEVSELLNIRPASVRQRIYRCCEMMGISSELELFFETVKRF